MKKTLLPFSFLFCLFAGELAHGKCRNCAHPTSQVSVSPDEKIYLQNHQIIFQDGKIFVTLNEITSAVPRIFCDEMGYFIVVKQPDEQ